MSITPMHKTNATTNAQTKANNNATNAQTNETNATHNTAHVRTPDAVQDINRCSDPESDVRNSRYITSVQTCRARRLDISIRIFKPSSGGLGIGQSREWERSKCFGLIHTTQRAQRLTARNEPQ